MALARIGIGANLGEAAATVRRAITELAGLGTVVRASSLYRTKPWGVEDQPDFINAAALLETSLAPRELLRALQAVERALGRTPTFRWGPRVVDLDLLAYDDLVVAEPDLALPHPRLHERAFVLAPLAEIDPSFQPALSALPESARAEAEKLPV